MTIANLCVYAGSEDDTLTVYNSTNMGGGKYGARLIPGGVAAGSDWEEDGTWAVTAP